MNFHRSLIFLLLKSDSEAVYLDFKEMSKELIKFFKINFSGFIVQEDLKCLSFVVIFYKTSIDLTFNLESLEETREELDDLGHW